METERLADPRAALVELGDWGFLQMGRGVNRFAVGWRPMCFVGRKPATSCTPRTGKLLHFRLADNSKYGGGANVQAGRNFFINGDGAFTLAAGTFLGIVGDHAVLVGDNLYSATPTELRAYDMSPAGQPGWRPKPLSAVPLPGVEALTAAGSPLSAPWAASSPSTCR